MLDDDIPEVRQLSADLVDVLSTFDDRLVRGDVDYDQHRKFALRACMLSLHLSSVQSILDLFLYPSCFALVRTCLEHHLLDHLMMLGYRYVQVFKDVSDEQWTELLENYHEGGPGTNTIVEEPTRSAKGHVRIVREGLYPKSDDEAEEYAIPLTYFVAAEYSPFVGRPSEQEAFHDGLTDVERLRDNAGRHREMYEQHLRWSSLRDSLQLNEFYTERDLLALDVHYRFLSAFTHGTQEAYDIAYPRGLFHGSPPIYDHYSHELVLLYLLVIGARELEVLLTMADAKPKIEVADRDQVEAIIQEAVVASSHLWFPGTEPHRLDRVKEANHRAWKLWREEGELKTVDPDEIANEEIGYYQNPLARLAQLHTTHREITTGLSYESPWPRADAMQRAV